MRKRILPILFFTCVTFGMAAQSDTTYTNPVVSQSLPDPTVIRASDGYFYLYATEDIHNVPIFRSENLVNWTFLRTAFTNQTRPNFEPNGGIWAPDINYINGKYVLFYAMSVWGGGETCGIGVAISNNPGGPFTDKGKLFRSNEIGVHNSIDPCYVEDNGKKYLFWGSFFGIYCVELSDDGLSLKNPANPQPVTVAGTAFEAVYIHKRGNYYYMFASIGSCCEGLNSTYRLVVGRSQSLTGPYLNKQGQSMLSNGYSPVVNSNVRFKGNGHCSKIVQDDAGNDWILFHGYDAENPSNGRVPLLNRVNWDINNWPNVENASPATTATKPLFGLNASQNLYIMGGPLNKNIAGGNWLLKDAVGMERDTLKPFVFYYRGELRYNTFGDEPGNIKFLVGRTWNDNYHPAGTTNVPLLQATKIRRNGDDTKWTIPEDRSGDGYYAITVNTLDETIEVNFEPGTAITPLKANDRVNVFASDRKLFVQDAKRQILKVSVSGINGIKLLEKSFSGHAEFSLPEGFYIVKVTNSENETFTKKVIIY